VRARAPASPSAAPPPGPAPPPRPRPPPSFCKNRYGLRQHVKNYGECLDIILDRVEPDETETSDTAAQNACALYGLIHARYVLTQRGLDSMHHKFVKGHFGTCPRAHCHMEAEQGVVPMGLRDEPRHDTVKLFCPKCRQVYRAPRQRGAEPLDGAYFGTTFPHLYFMEYGSDDGAAARAEPEQYVPRVFGFRVRDRNAPPPVAAAAAAPSSAAAAAAAPPAASPNGKAAAAAAAVPEAMTNGKEAARRAGSGKQAGGAAATAAGGDGGNGGTSAARGAVIFEVEGDGTGAQRVSKKQRIRS